MDDLDLSAVTPAGTGAKPAFVAWPAPLPGKRPEDYFPAPALEPNVFDIGLVMGGTVSAGTYTAGVLDFLFEALDQWEAAKAGELEGVDKDEIPDHRVRLRVISGTSGGGINALLAARALHYRFPPAAKDSAIVRAIHDSPNPFFEVWVNDADITKMLDNSDLNGSAAVSSILNGAALQKIASDALDFPSGRQLRSGLVRPCGGRKWTYDPLSIAVTHTNLSGVPYVQNYAGLGVSQEFFTSHADYVHLYVGASPDAGVTGSKVPVLPGMSWLNVPQNSGIASATAPTGLAEIPWSRITQNALGTSAFPIGMPARNVQRDASHYAYRFVQNNVTGECQWISPFWSRVAENPATLSAYSFISFDGGCTDNQPITLARQALEGLERQKDSSADDATRGLILIDPLCDPLPTTSAEVSLAKLFAPLIHMFVGANRFATADMVGFLDPKVFNRFLIGPKRKLHDDSATVGGKALCGEGLGAFLGFMCRDYREHDFLLGRKNCQDFLTQTFVLGDGNTLFAAGIQPQLDASLPKPMGGVRPIVPLYGSASVPQQQPDWPAGKFRPNAVKGPIADRVRHTLDHVNGFLRMPSYEEMAIRPLVNLVIVPKIADKIVSIIDDAIGRKGL